ncbi:hypothetical protein Tco_1109889 [Tanacetum coccineum]|uniref:Uncharacterized protein n=1 Tax=Tanacetum coccineum TaxID=301880 RepID=A0ABQ5IHQ5_9ASTR
MPTEMELTLEQTQQGVSHEVSNIRVISFTMKMEILLDPTSNKLMVEHAEFDESNANVLERFYTSVGNPVKEILLKLNIPDHRKLKDGGEEAQEWVQDSDEEPVDQELEAPYLYMSKVQKVIPVEDKGTEPIVNKEPLEQVHINDEYNVFSMDNENPKQPEYVNDTYMMEQCDSNTTPHSSDISNNGGEADQDEQKFQKNMLCLLLYLNK